MNDQPPDDPLRYSVLPLRPVPFEVYTPAEAWDGRLSFPPVGTHERWHRLNLYRALYDGEWEQLGSVGLEIQINLFGSIADFWADLMSSYPPTLSVDDDVLQNDVNAAIYTAIQNYWMYGVGVLHPYVDDTGQAHIETIDPRLWYPMPQQQGDTLISFVEGRYIEARIIPRDGESEIRTFRLQDAQSDPFGIASVVDPRVPPYEASFGEQVSRQTFPPLQGRGVVPVAAPPMYGDWGTSIYPRIASMVLEISRRSSDISIASSLHTLPLPVIKGQPKVTSDNKSFVDDSRPTHGQAADQRNRAIDRMRRTGGFLEVEPGVEVEYATWDAKLDAQFHQLEWMLTQSLNEARTPLSLLGIQTDTERLPNRVSGEALRRLYIPTFLKSSQLQKQFTAGLKACLSALGVESEIDWPEPLGKLEEDAPSNLPMRGARTTTVEEAGEQEPDDADSVQSG